MTTVNSADRYRASEPHSLRSDRQMSTTLLSVAPSYRRDGFITPGVWKFEGRSMFVDLAIFLARPLRDFFFSPVERYFAITAEVGTAAAYADRIHNYEMLSLDFVSLIP